MADSESSTSIVASIPDRHRPNISALAREQGVSRTTIRRRLAAGWQPPVVEILPPAPSTPVHQPWTPGILILTAIGIGILAIGVNAQAGFALGATPLARATFAGMAVAADVLAFVLPAAAVALWARNRAVLAGLAWTTWTAVAALAVLATLGFVERNTGDAAAERQSIVQNLTAASDQRAASIATAQIAVQNLTAARETECKRRGPLCRELEANERTALANLRSAIAAPLPSASNISTADPQVVGAQRLATWAGLSVSTDDVVNLRLSLLVLIPNLAGLVLAFGLALRRD